MAITENNSSIPVSVTFTELVKNSKKNIRQGWVIIARDVREQHEIMKNISYMANTDYLTDTFNRKRFEEELQKKIELANRKLIHSAVFIFDIDHFKEINDNFGHLVGDFILKSFARIVKSILRSTDMLFRLGGDEFAIICDNISKNNVHEFATKILNIIRGTLIEINQHEIYITVRAGIALLPDHGNNLHDIISNADLSLYRCKKDRVLLYQIYDVKEIDQHNIFKSNVNISSQIKHALEEHSFVLFAQPIVSFTRPTTKIYELLLRIIDQDNIILPEVFLDVAQNYGYIQEIDNFVINKAIEIINTNKNITVSCNMSSSALTNKNLLTRLIKMVKENKFDSTRMIIEVTENTAITNIPAAINFITQCKKLGIKFALDDFGVGFSSYTYLKYLPVDFLKIDGSFIKDISKNKIDKHFVISMVSIANALNMQTIAEYIENEETAKIVSDLGVTFGQGYYYGKPENIF